MSAGLTRQQLQELYQPSPDEFVLVDVPEIPFFMLDGEGSPDTPEFEQAIQWLFVSIHPIKMEARKRMGRNFVEPPLEALWWADDMADLRAGRRDRLKWRLMIPGPEWADEAMYADAIGQVHSVGVVRR